MKGTFRFLDFRVADAEANWSRYVEYVVGRIRGEHPENAFVTYSGQLAAFLMAGGAETARRFGEPLFDPFLRSVRATPGSPEADDPHEWNSRLALGSAFRCMSLTLPDDVEAMLRERAGTAIINPSRDAHPLVFWNTGMAALAWGAQSRYRVVAGLIPGEGLAFQPNARLGFNVQGYLRHFAAAIEEGRTWEEVEPAWRELVANWNTLNSTMSANTNTLLFAAEALQVYVRKGPHAGAGDLLHESVVAEDARSAS